MIRLSISKSSFLIKHGGDCDTLLQNQKRLGGFHKKSNFITEKTPCKYHDKDFEGAKKEAKILLKNGT